MGFLKFLEVASMPIIEVLLISTLGAFMGTKYCNLLPSDARKSLNKIVFMVFTPSLMFASLAKTVTVEDVISWWFMPINIGLTYIFGGIMGWILVKVMKPEPYLEGLVIAMSSSGNLGNLLLIIVHATCRERGSPFGDRHVCGSVGLSYASFSMALGGFYMWSYTFHLIRNSAVKYEAYRELLDNKMPNKDFDDNEDAILLKGENAINDVPIVFSTSRSFKQDQERSSMFLSQNSMKLEELQDASTCHSLVGILREIVEEVKAPPTIAAIAGLIFGGVKWLKNLIIGDDAPLRVIQGSIELLGEGTIPCITLILGGNLSHGLRSSKLKVPVIVGVVLIKYAMLPVIGLYVVRTAESLGILPPDPLFHYVLLLQFTMPPGMNIGTMTQLVDVGQAECSVLFLWTYVVAAFSLAVWSTVYMWILS
uniref:Uncharacterized protein n=2 Tax=Kalanchoe fedtschenkoi TaxID=63787 RepID=A0A7N0UGK5_KALFE